MRTRRAAALRHTGAVLCIAAVSGGLLLASGSAQAAWVSLTENGLAGHLTLHSDPAPADLRLLSPGAPVQWQIRADLADPYSPLTIQFERDGDLVGRPDGLWIQVRACDTEWANFPTSPVCPSAATVVAPLPAMSSSLGATGPVTPTTPSFLVGDLWHSVGKYILITLSLPDTAQARADSSLMGLTATIGVGLTASGGNAPPVPSNPAGLASTGSDILGTVLVALGALGFGLLLRSRRGMRITRRAQS